MVTDESKFQLSQLCRLRQELGIPINAIIGHAEVAVNEQVTVPGTKGYRILVVDDSGIRDENKNLV